MKGTAQSNKPTTQKFIGIENILDDIVILPGRMACQIIEVIATNFSLQSADEQQVKILSYASLLNSLSFPIQVVILSRKLDISSYISLLDVEARRTTNPKLSSHIDQYKDFISDLVKNNVVLDKKFYIAISFSFLEKGAASVGGAKNIDSFTSDAKNVLKSKSGSILQELARIGLNSKVLTENELVEVFYEIYNQEKPGEKLLDAMGETHVKGTRK